MPRLLGLAKGTTDGGRGRRQLQRRRTRVSQRLRHELESARIASATVEAVQEALRPRRTSVWLGFAVGEAPRLAATAGATTNGDPAIPVPVPECVLRKRLVWNPLLRSLAVPLLGPRSGVIGVILLEQTSESVEQHVFVEAVAREAGLALEAANQYERALAAKEKTEAILAHIGSGVVVTDPRGLVLQFNSAAESIMGAPADAVVGRPCSHVIGLHAGERPLDCSRGCALLIAKSDDASIGEIWRHHPDGRRQPLLASAQPLRDADGHVTEIVHSFRDVTRLKQADEAKTMFLATASHELKTPLTVIQGFAQTLLDDERWTEAERRAALEAMQRRAIELNKIVDRILLSSRIETGQARVVVKEVALTPILAERVDALRSATRHAITFRVPEDLPLVLGDPDSVATVVDHLLDNAVKYSPGGEAIELRARSRGDEVDIEVADHGIGMDAEEVEHCFERFWQAESSDVRRFGGTGIGLYIVRSLMEAMHGRVGVESVPGRGTTFVLTLRQTRANGSPPPQRHDGEHDDEPLPSEPSVIREFMRQMGVPDRGTR